MSNTIYQLSDLANKRTDFIADAKQGLARLRDKDGTSLVMLPEATLTYLQRVQELTGLHLTLDRLVNAATPASIHELGDHAWLRVFDSEDLQEFAAELGEALLAARGDEHTRVADAAIAEWRLTATQLADPLRRSVLLSDETGSDDLSEVSRPAVESGPSTDDGS